MLHPRLTPLGKTIGGADSVWLAEIGDYGSWGDLKFSTRWGQSACGMYEASWTMPLPSTYSNRLLRRGTIVELVDGARRVGSPLVMAQPSRGSGYGTPWQFTATGVGSEVTGDSAWYAFDGTDASTVIASDAITTAIANGLPWADYDAATVPSGPFGGVGAGDVPFTIGGLLSAIGDAAGVRWGVGDDNIVRFMFEVTAPSYMATPDVAQLAVADDDYATVVRTVRIDSTSGLVAYTKSPASPSNVQLAYGRREYLFDATGVGPISAATAQALGDGFLARAKGRLGYLDKLTVTSNQLLTMGGGSGDLQLAAEKVGTGLMVRMHGVFDDLLEYTGSTWLDIIIGQADFTDGAQELTLTPLGFVARDLASVQEETTAAAFGS